MTYRTNNTLDRLSGRDIADFAAYLRACTDRQVRGVYEKEMARGGNGPAYAALARLEADRRGIELT